jgi:pSer/pThr/pTyr-binding forkhead associated (FHA) protein
MKCSGCHTEFKFCPCCGQPLHIETTSQQITLPLPVMAKLVLKNEIDNSEVVFLLDKDNNLVGRKHKSKNILPEVDLTALDPDGSVSRRHARIFKEGNQFFIEDLNSSNKTNIIRDEEAKMLSPKTPQPLKDGDRLRFGPVIAHFELIPGKEIDPKTRRT